ncbi:amidohydrolase [Sulfitobacter sp. PR48]|uniref:amidohydrolase n=1 Tax=Sulfitobacter sp. PR48 TaxID=3028383 RepID=UPI00237BE3AE|nr:amidohydrolase [Sulfitobacter sp. PR48]MDD9720715.1 amidohydrolase [Sulfitobacter sp. PR48]
MTQADIVIRNAQILTMDERAPTAQSMALLGNKIAAVGRHEDTADLIGPKTRVIDADGATVLPGFVESHLHLFSAAYGRRFLQMSEIDDLEAAKTALRQFAADNPDEGLLVAQGTTYELLAGHGKDPRQLIDEMVRDRPVLVLSFDFHTGWANSAALEQAGLSRGRDVGAGSEVVVGPDGMATGELREKNAIGPVRALRTSGGREMLGNYGLEPETPPTPEERAQDIAVLKEGLAFCAAQGITSIHNMDGNRYLLELLKEIEDAGELTVRVEVPFHLTREKPLSSLDEASRLAADFNSDKLKSGRVKIFCDGVLESGTGVLVDEYANQPGHRGEPIFEAAHFNKAAIDIDARGLQISVHAIGDGAVRIVLDGVQAAQEANGKRDARHRIEHLEVVHPEDLPRFRELGVIASMQPLHVPGVMGLPLEPAVSVIGEARLPFAYAWRDVIETGADYAFSSDWPVVRVEPLVGISAALTREPFHPGVPDQRVPLMQVLEGFTWRGAFAGHMDDRTGRICTGMLADLVILGGDIAATDPKEIPGLGPVMTICDGQITFEATQGPGA